MKTKILLSIIAVLFVAVLYLLFLNLQKPSTPVIVTQTPTIIPTQAIDPTIGWKTYTDKNWNYSVKYPADWKIVSFQKPTIDIMPANSDDPRLGSISLSLTMNQETPVVPPSFTNFSKVDPSSCGNSTWAVKNNENDSFACWKYNRDVWFTVEYSSEVTKDIYYQIVSSFRFREIEEMERLFDAINKSLYTNLISESSVDDYFVNNIKVTKKGQKLNLTTAITSKNHINQVFGVLQEFGLIIGGQSGEGVTDFTSKIMDCNFYSSSRTNSIELSCSYK